MAEIQITQIQCNTFIDYSTVPGTPILPFQIQLDPVLSRLNPLPGQNQRFCYQVSGVGLNNSTYRDLSHLVFGICDEIPAAQITNISVTIDGIPQTIDFGSGGNVELRNPIPDPPTGCLGLKFDFGLDKVDGEMLICYELTQTYPIGPNNVCLFASGVTRTGLAICGPVCNGVDNDCIKTVYQEASVCVPVAVRPFAIPGPTVTRCCGNPIIRDVSFRCGGSLNGTCTFRITQDICIEVPILFGANADVGVPFVTCGEVSNEDICTGCGENGD